MERRLCNGPLSVVDEDFGLEEEGDQSEGARGSISRLLLVLLSRA